MIINHRNILVMLMSLESKFTEIEVEYFELAVYYLINDFCYLSKVEAFVCNLPVMTSEEKRFSNVNQVFRHWISTISGAPFSFLAE